MSSEECESGCVNVDDEDNSPPSNAPQSEGYAL